MYETNLTVKNKTTIIMKMYYNNNYNYIIYLFKMSGHDLSR